MRAQPRPGGHPADQAGVGGADFAGEREVTAEVPAGPGGGAPGQGEPGAGPVVPGQPGSE